MNECVDYVKLNEHCESCIVFAKCTHVCEYSGLFVVVNSVPGLYNVCLCSFNIIILLSWCPGRS